MTSIEPIGTRGKSHSTPFFIMGCPRSGTTLMSRILDSHSQLAVYYETNYYNIFHPISHLYGDLKNPDNIKRLIDDFQESITMQSVTPPSLNEFRENLTEATLSGVLETLLHIYAERRGKLRGGDKTPGHYTYLKNILDDFPESQIIFIVRDPRDTVISMRRAFQTGLNEDIITWNDAFHASKTQSNQLYRVRYEDLVEHPTQTLKSICQFLKVQFEPAMMDFCNHIPENIASRFHLKKLQGKIDASSVGNFKELPPKEIARIEAACSEGINELGYSAINTPSISSHRAPVPKRSHPLFKAINQLRYYGFHRERWKRGIFRWKISLRLLIRHYLTVLLTRRHPMGTSK